MKLLIPSRFVIRQDGEDGYVLLTIILFVALLAIAMTAMAPVITQQIKRDREEELIHRGVQYSRAIKHYVKKFGRYPTKLEDLESTSNVRFLRKRYKDPITGKDFKLLHMGEVQTSFGSSIAGATSVATLAAGSQASGGAFGNNSTFGGGTFGGSNAGGSFGGGTFGSFGNSGSSAQGSGTNTPQGNQDQSQGTDASAADQKVPGQPDQSESSGNKVFGGGPIVGVASISKEKSIRVFNKKEHYYQWQFIYDPSTDTGGLLSTPNQPGLQSAAGVIQPGVQGQPTQSTPFGTQGSPFSQGSSLGFQGGGTQTSPGGLQSGSPQPQPQSPQSAFPPDQAPQQ